MRSIASHHRLLSLRCKRSQDHHMPTSLHWHLKKPKNMSSIKRERLRLMMEDGSFKALLSSSRRPKKLKAAKQTTVTPAQEALVGRVFEDEGTWKILKVEWDSGLDSIIVFYYDFNAAKREMIDEDDLDEDHEYVEHSSIEEVMEWMSN